ncbi:MAG TPA: hypothetical protein PLX89_03930, partial [Verrucomicrobiota bacterium]|nr:hypothetical protein [Verrucomicrobiota bacterium]
MRVKSIGLVCPFEGKVSPRLLEGLAEWSGVQFRELLRPDPANVDGLIVVTRDPGAAVASFLNSPVPTLLVAEPGTVSDREDVRFAGIDKVDQSLRGVTLPEPGGDLPAAMSDTLGGEVLAFKGSRAAWIHWSCSGGGLDLALCPPPAIPARGYLHDHFGTTRFLSLLPWLDFVRRVRGSDGWEPETRQACIVFDDPSLYRPRYGYVDFEALAQHASAHHHHVSIATVPLDLLGASRRTAAIFREHRSVLSLLVHGNNHLSREMARPGSPQTRLQMAGQIIRRA